MYLARVFSQRTNREGWLIPNVGASTPWMRTLNRTEVGKELGNRVFTLPFLLSLAYHGLSDFAGSGPLYRDGANKIASHITSSFLQVVSVRYFVIATRKVANTPGIYFNCSLKWPWKFSSTVFDYSRFTKWLFIAEFGSQMYPAWFNLCFSKCQVSLINLEHENHRLHQAKYSYAL